MKTSFAPLNPVHAVCMPSNAVSSAGVHEVSASRVMASSATAIEAARPLPPSVSAPE